MKKLALSRRKSLLLGAVLLLVAAAGVYAFWPRPGAREEEPVNSAESSRKSEEKPDEPEYIRLIASGDMLPHETVNAQAKTAAGYNYRQFFSAVKPIFEGADLRFCNQEAPSAGESFGISAYPTFNAPAAFAKDLSATGCNIVSLANNHLNDRGQAVINKTLDIWDELKPLAHAGANRTAAEQAKVRYFEAGGITFAFTAYAQFSNNRKLTSYGVNLLDESLVRKHLTEARRRADVVLVSVHWGTEYSSSINSFQERWAKTFAELGADVVIGHGPHVLQPVKRLPKSGGGETLVWYSLGNMLSTQLDIESLIGGFAVMDINPSTKTISSIGFLPTYMHYEWTANQRASENLLARKNLMIYPLEKSAEALKKSLNHTTVADQTQRVKNVLNRYTVVPLMTVAEYQK